MKYTVSDLTEMYDPNIQRAHFIQNKLLIDSYTFCRNCNLGLKFPSNVSLKTFRN